MQYAITQEQREWMQALIDLLPAGILKDSAQDWLDNHTQAGDGQINAFLNYFDGSDFKPQVQEFATWLKGGDRPPHPPTHP
jgi:hypothetical protein